MIDRPNALLHRLFRDAVAEPMLAAQILFRPPDGHWRGVDSSVVSNSIGGAA